MIKFPTTQLQTLFGKCGTVAVFSLLYGLYKLYDMGFSLEHYLHTYVLIFGGIASYVIVFNYAKISGKWSVSKMIGIWSGFIPLFFSAYLMGFLGVYGLWGLRNGFTMLTLISGIIWLHLGYRLLYNFWLITEIKGREPKLSR